MRELLLGIDIGTSSCKVAVFTREGVSVSSESESYPVSRPRTGWAEQDPEHWWSSVCAAMKRIFSKGEVQPAEIAAVGVDGQSWAAVAIDGEGKSLFPNPLWMDTRAESICEEINRRVGAGRIFETAGNPLEPMYTTPKVLWYQETSPERAVKIEKILQCNGYIVFRLTGEATQDLSQGYGWHCFDMRRGIWDPEMAKELGINPGLLPDIVSCDTVVGKVTKKAAEESGIPEGTPVVAGGLDAACGTLGAGVLRDGETQEQGGQAGGMSICMETYHADPRLILSFHVVPDRWLLQGGTTGGGGVMRWLSEEFGGEERLAEAKGGEKALTLMNHAAAAVAPGCDGLVFLPYMSGERTPIWDPKAKGVFFGIDFSKTKGHFIRAGMEGVAYSLRHNLEVAEAAGAKAEVLKAVGGAANSELWTQIKADVTGKEITVPASDTATTWGACLLAGKGIGMFSSYEEAIRLTVREKRRYTPKEANRAAYDHAYGIYRALYENLKELMQG